LKVAEKHLKQGKPVEGLPIKYEGSLQIMTMPDFFWENVGEKALKEKIKRPLQGLNLVCYYGCLTSRPPKITDARNPEDPQEMDSVLRSLGASVKNWSFKADCCGGDLTLTRPDLHMRLTQRILDMSIEAGADCIAVACPMCHENLESKQAEISEETGRSYNIPIFYFTELMGLAFGDPAVEKWLSRHTVDPMPLLREKGLLEMQVRR
jgi:heterodisulfide reductase subunit B